ncbi:hypothetical protein KOI35_32215 [Actinoplanes bogorensis]|uniref:Uncharacterized protein n=1 Tax=Paractinoplanes bogorensis TaxID=1610840 RepID=A0ABS5YXM1_9ACTN|nr:hypothetical protein [Actinoplanes bogorensis]MBU2668187.1 hypothetical protein [Actinoplanes bogorensis]
MTGRAVWRRATPAGQETSGDDRLRCGGPEMSVEERYQMMRERRLAAKKAPEEKPKAKDHDDEEDELKAAERFRNDRYAVKLLKQDDDAWGGGADNTGTLG